MTGLKIGIGRWSGVDFFLVEIIKFRIAVFYLSNYLFLSVVLMCYLF